jgi:DNA-binding transcriptional regulator GbsR (MarR family)
MLIVKNLFSFYAEFEILLYFLLFCRLWNVNKDVNMRNNAWNEMDRTYTKKSSEKHFCTKITDRNNEICSLVRSVKKVQKLRTDILKCRTVIFGAANANLQF